MEEFLVSSLSYEGSGTRGFVRNLCFVVFGLTIFHNPLEPFNIVRMSIGAVFCLIFGFLFKKFLRGFLILINRDIKEKFGKPIINMAVDNAMLFLVPYSIMILIATYLLGWTLTAPFISSGIMIVGVSASLEISRLMKKPKLKNTIITTGVSFIFSFGITFFTPYLIRLSSIIEAVIRLIPILLERWGGI